LNTKHRYKFKKAQKIKRQKDISGLFKTGKKWDCNNCTVFYSENGTNRSRCATIVPKEIGTAVLRNKIKRHIRETFRRNLKNRLLHIDILVKIHQVKEANKIKQALEKSLCLWLDTIKK
jgi:ribonuclease P protein component